jgi:fatty aldehyde-generating acyl-ACP reductase
MNNQQNKVGFMVHSRDLRDFLKKFPFLKHAPKSFLLFLTKAAPPIVVSKITGLVSKEGEHIEGYVIGIPMTAHQMIEDRKTALKKITQAVHLAEKKRIGIIGLGALTASLSRGGLDVAGKTSVGITTGRAYTVKTVTDYVKRIMDLFEMKPEATRIAIVGAAGAIGSGCAKFLAQYGVQNFLFIDLERKAENLKKHIEDITGRHGGANIEISHRVADIKGWDIVIAATNAPEVLITPDDLDPGTIIINDAQPSDISPEVLEMEDVLVIEGGVIHTPGVSCNFNMGLAARNDNFCCLGEALILAHSGRFHDFALGELEIPLIEEVSRMSETMNIGLAKIQNSTGAISEEQLRHIKEIIKARARSTGAASRA